ncbi:MAG: hypothetical protein U1E05_15490 [Patescibacteria group bacterium]|nr:hypothetical protein [Patescibacteria group bacterium]
MKARLQKVVNSLMSDVDELMNTPSVVLGVAAPPDSSGVYILLVSDKVVYVGEARGSKGLRDRLLSKHLSGDDNHAIQRAFKATFPDRKERRAHIKEIVSARWLEIEDHNRVSALERLLIWLLDPEWNRK